MVVPVTGVDTITPGRGAFWDSDDERWVLEGETLLAGHEYLSVIIKPPVRAEPDGEHLDSTQHV